MTDLVKATPVEATELEAAFLAGLEEAQGAYERIVATQAWTALGFDSFAAWWDERVSPAMRALSMRPTREIAAAVIEQVRQEEAALPSAQRRTQRELAEMVGVDRSTLANRDGSRSVQREESPRSDLAEPTSVGQRPTQIPARQEEGDAILKGVDTYVATTAVTAVVDPPAEGAATDMDRMLAARAAVDAVTERLLPPDPEAPHRAWRINFLAAIQPATRLMAGFTVGAVAEHADDECLDELRRLAQEIGTYYDRVRAARPVPDNVRHLRAV